jgi:periplasmic protein TonB
MRPSEDPTGALDCGCRPDTIVAGPQLFAEALLENSSTRPNTRKGDFIVSVVSHGVLLAIIMLAPLYFTKTVQFSPMRATELIGPPASALMSAKPVASAVPTSVPAKNVVTSAVKLSLPSPHKQAAEEVVSAAPGQLTGVAPGTAGTITGGQLGGVMGGILTSAPSTYVPPPASAKPSAETPIRTGGDVKEPRLISFVNPIYPVILRQANVSGDVVIDAVVDANGNVAKMQPVSGQRLLVAAAMDAVRQWRYQPTLLNGQPIPVIVRVTVTFRLSPYS